METTVVFITDSTNDVEQELYTRISLKRLVDGDPNSSTASWESVNDDSKGQSIAIEGGESPLLRKFKREQYGADNGDGNIGSNPWLKISTLEKDLALRYVNEAADDDVVCLAPHSEDVTLAKMYLFVDILYPKEDDFIQLHTQINLTNIELIGLLKDMPPFVKGQWFKQFVNEMTCDLGVYQLNLTHFLDKFHFIVKLKHRGIFKRILDLELKETADVDMNTYLLNDLNKLKMAQIKSHSREGVWYQEKRVLIKTLFQLSDLLTLNEITGAIMKENPQLKEIIGADLIQMKKSSPLSSLDILKSKADELFRTAIPNFYVPIIQRLQAKILELKGSQAGDLIGDEEGNKKRQREDQDEPVNEGSTVNKFKRVHSNINTVNDNDDDYETPPSANEKEDDAGDTGDADILSEDTQFSES